MAAHVSDADSIKSASREPSDAEDDVDDREPRGRRRHRRTVHRVKAAARLRDHTPDVSAQVRLGIRPDLASLWNGRAFGIHVFYLH